MPTLHKGKVADGFSDTGMTRRLLNSKLKPRASAASVALLIASLLALSACQPAGPATLSSPTAAVQVTVVTAIVAEPTATPMCVPLAEGMSLMVTPLPASSLRIELTGFPLGEHLAIALHAEAPARTARREEIFSQPVGADGRFVAEYGGLEPLEGSTTNHWGIEVFHSGGAACAEITLE